MADFIDLQEAAIENDPNLSIAGLAKKAGLDNSTIRQMIKNRRSPRIETAVKICSALGTTLEDFLAQSTNSVSKKDKSNRADENLGRRLNLIRKTLFPEMNRTEYAGMFGFNYTQYSSWESGYTRIMPDDATVICEKLGVDLDFIYRGLESGLPLHLIKAFSSER